MLWWQCQRHLAAVNATGGPFTVWDRSKVAWVQLGIRPIFLAVLITFQEQADRGVALAGKLDYLWSQLHRKSRGWICFGFFFFLTCEKPRGFLLGWSPWDLDCKYRAWNSLRPDFGARAQTEFKEVRNSPPSLLPWKVPLAVSRPPLGFRWGTAKTRAEQASLSPDLATDRGAGFS